MSDLKNAFNSNEVLNSSSRSQQNHKHIGKILGKL